MMQSDHELQPSYFGFVETRDDAVILIQACHQGRLPFVQRRPTSPERPYVAQSGHVFIYEEKASGIQRWTDGRHWSPSRVLGAFMIYGERSAPPDRSQPMNKENSPPLVEDALEDRHRQLYGPLAKSFHFKPEELAKKTIKVQDTVHSGATWHLMSYYRPMEVLKGQLQTPSMNQDSVLQWWHQSSDWTPYGNPSDGDRAEDSIILSTTRLWDFPSSEQHVQQAWPMLDGTELYQANAHQDPVPHLAVADKGALFWSPNVTVQLDPSLFTWGTYVPDNSSVSSPLSSDPYWQRNEIRMPGKMQ